MRRRFGQGCMPCLLFLLLGLARMPAADAAEVLVLHSYHHGYAWTDGIHEGIKSVLGNREDVELFVTHMDAKYLTDPATINLFEELLRQEYRIRFDAILCTDDPALDFMLERRDRLFPGVPLVFCGANGFDPARLEGVEGVTGVNEQISVTETVGVILRARPRTRRLVVVGDTTQAGLRNLELVRDAEPLFSGKLAFEYHEGSEPDTLRAMLTELGDQDAVLYVSYMQTREGKSLGLLESLRLVSGASPAPVFGLWDFLLGHGVTGGKIASGHAQGAAAAGMVERILAGEPVASIPVLMDSPNQCMFDHAQLERFGIRRRRLPKGSVILNMPRSFWRENGWWVFLFLLFIIFEAILIAWLFASRTSLGKARARLEESEARRRLYIERAPMAVFLCDADGRYLDVNPRACRISGYSREELLEMNLRQTLPPESEEAGARHFTQVRREGYAEAEMLKRRKDGTLYWSQVQAVRLAHDRFIAFSQDVTPRKEAAQEILRAKEAWERTFDAVPDLICLLDADYRITKANRAFVDRMGTSPEDVLGQPCFRLVHGTDDPPAFCPHRRTQEDHCEHVEEVHEENLGGDFLVTATPLFDADGSFAGSVHVARDITDRKRYEAALAESEGRLRAMLAAMPDIVLRIDAEGRFLDCHSADPSKMLVPPDEATGRLAREILAPAFAGQIMAKIGATLASDAMQVFEYDLDMGGDLFRFEARMVPCGAGEVLALVRDITREHRAQEALADSEKHLRMAMQVARLGSWEIEVPSMRRWWSPEVFGIVGLSPENGPPSAEEYKRRIHPDDFPVWRESLDVMLTGKPQSCSYRVRRPDGREIHIEAHGEPQLDDAGNVTRIIGTVRDITERVRAEEERLQLERQVQQTQKLESLGVLAGGIAHDFNNLLMAILGNADMALSELPESSPARENLGEIEHASRRAADLCRQMLAYSGRGRFVVEVFHIADLVDEMTHLLQTSVSKKVVLRISHDPGLPPMEGDATQIRQIIMNLVINASEAIGDNVGVVRVSTGMRQCARADLDNAYLSHNLPEGIYLCIEVTDTGCGMDEETLGRLFEPFFTTKFTGRGLGMSAVLGIVRGHKGTLNVKSVVGQGTTFEILLPPSEKVAKADNEQKPALPAVWRGSGLVLLVDDEESIRRLGATMLERMGFEVITAADGLEAVGLYQREAGRVSLVLLDLTMPHMDGEETFHALREIDPGVRVVMASGYSGHEIEARFGGQGLLGVIQKPYTMAALRGTLSRALGQV